MFFARIIFLSLYFSIILPVIKPEEIEKIVSRVEAGVPFVIHIGHKFFQVATSGQDINNVQSAYAKIEENNFLKSIETLMKNHPGMSIGITAATFYCCLYYYIYSLSQKILDDRSWVALLLDETAMVDCSDICSETFVYEECVSWYQGNSPTGVFRKAYKDICKESLHLRKFFIWYGIFRFLYPRFLFSKQEYLYENRNNFTQVLKTIANVIASLMVSRYPSK